MHHLLSFDKCTVVPLYLWGGYVPSPPGVPETVDNTKPYTYYVLPYRYLAMIKFSLQIRHVKKLTIGTNNKIEQY